MEHFHYDESNDGESKMNTWIVFVVCTLFSAALFREREVEFGIAFALLALVSFLMAAFTTLRKIDAKN